MRDFLCKVNTLISEREIYYYSKRFIAILKETKEKSTTKLQDTPTISPQVGRVPIDCHCEPDKNGNHGQNH